MTQTSTSSAQEIRLRSCSIGLEGLNGRSDPHTGSQYPIGIVAAMTSAAFLNSISSQSIVVILPDISAALHIPQSRQQWVVSSYALTFGCFTILCGRIADVYGRKLLFRLGMILVIVATAPAAFIPFEIGFDVFRGLHGVGAAANNCAAIGIIASSTSEGRARTKAFSMFAIGASMGSICGNLLSGFIVTIASWKWVFGSIAFAAVLVTSIGFVVVPALPSSTADDDTGETAVDWTGGALITLAIMTFLFALSEGEYFGWQTYWIYLLISVCVLLLAAFLKWQLHLEHRSAQPPLIRLSMFRQTRLGVILLAAALFAACFNNFIIFATYYFQDLQGYSPLQTGLRFLPLGIAGILVALCSTRLLTRLPVHVVISVGSALIAIPCLLFALPISLTTSYFARGLPAMLFAAVGADTTWPCLTVLTSQAVKPGDQAVGGALINAAGQIGRAIGLTLTAVIEASVLRNGNGLEPSLQAAFYVNFAFGMMSALIALVAFRGMRIEGKS